MKWDFQNEIGKLEKEKVKDERKKEKGK